MVSGDVDDFDRGNGNHYVSIRVTCKTPSPETAAAIVSEITTYQTAAADIVRNGKNDQMQFIFNPPWKSHEISPSTSAFFRGMVRQDEARIIMDGVDFHHLGHGFPALINWLREKGCTNFEYRMEEIIEEDDED